MRIFPDEIELLSLFETNPDFLDTMEIPFYYNEMVYRFSNKEEEFEIKLAPSVGELSIKVFQKETCNLLFKLLLISVSNFEIKEDTKEKNCIQLVLDHEEILQIYEISFKPKFSLILTEEFDR
ncbi:hypothetical protein [Lysinibacillus sphaericus]|uniref:hypothetical protein n=1 Tax=Lysinibacillus sphaericus TaxID=1421 RepID=UPI001910CAA5|nr:hypothetical protein [Lysinibacillus sphaericus]QPA54982.1 hypothetical protein INQ53_02745 [Lysinibacillus sphaericus]